jgi:anti-sigma factor RsiW
MRCRDFERLIIDSKERELLREERIALEKHLEGCAACARFRTFWEGFQKAGLRQSPGPELSSELSEKTRLRCRAELDSPAARPSARESGARPAAPPWPILAALLVLTGLTVIFLVPGVEAFFKTQKVTVETVLAFFLFLQNAVMLLFTPVLLRRGRLSPMDIRFSE